MNSSNPKISIVTASYNYEDLIKETIESVLAQTYSEWELIIVDDGSTDNSREVIKSYANRDERISLFTHPDNTNKGLCETVKLGCERATGEYIAFLESDDVWTPNYLEEKINALKSYPEVRLIFNSVEMFGDNKTIGEYEKYFQISGKILDKIRFPANIFNAMLLINLVPTFSCAMVKKETLLACNFDNLYGPWLDWGLWLQITYKHSVAYLPKNLTKWRMHQKSYINTSDKIKRNNNQIMRSVAKNIFCAEQNPLKKTILTNYYYMVLIFFKTTKGLIKKLIMAL